ncbi:MAG: hypothetical protein JXB39_06025 [Deltaproteobacteria bacterium]|nr:hypothetical protein [Deltaproteobacteria bacterium]
MIPDLARVVDGAGELEARGRFADSLDGLGSWGRKLAARTREEAGPLTVAAALRRLAAALWWDRVRHVALDGVLRRHPGLPLALLDRPGFRPWGRAAVEEVPGRGRCLVDASGRVILGDLLEVPDRGPGLPVDLFDRLDTWTREGAGLLGSPLFALFLLWIQWEIHRWPIPGTVPLLEVVGWEALAREVRGYTAGSDGGTSHKDADQLRALAWCLDGTRFVFPDGGAGRLLTCTLRERGGRGTPERFTLQPGAPLLPGYLYQLPQRERKIVPALRRLPPLVGRGQDRGAVAGLTFHVLAEMRRRCAEMVGDLEGQDLGLHLDAGRWRELADRARVPRPTLADALDRWRRDGPDGPAFLREVSRDRFTLAPVHEDARRVLLLFGREAKDGREGRPPERKRKNRRRGRRKA